MCAHNDILYLGWYNVLINIDLKNNYKQKLIKTTKDSISQIV
jgi:hypothetical protein